MVVVTMFGERFFFINRDRDSTPIDRSWRIKGVVAVASLPRYELVGRNELISMVGRRENGRGGVLDKGPRHKTLAQLLALQTPDCYVNYAVGLCVLYIMHD